MEKGIVRREQRFDVLFCRTICATIRCSWTAGHWWETEGEKSKEGCFDRGWKMIVLQFASMYFRCIISSGATPNWKDLRKHGFKTMQEITEGWEWSAMISGSHWRWHGMKIWCQGEAVEVEGGSGGRGWEYLLGMPLWSGPLHQKNTADSSINCLGKTCWNKVPHCGKGGNSFGTTEGKAGAAFNKQSICPAVLAAPLDRQNCKNCNALLLRLGISPEIPPILDHKIKFDCLMLLCFWVLHCNHCTKPACSAEKPGDVGDGSQCDPHWARSTAWDSRFPASPCLNAWFVTTLLPSNS